MKDKQKNNKWSIQVWNEWSALFIPRRYNWISFTLINIYFEWYREWGQLELQVVILGFGFYLTYDLGETEFRKEIYRRAKETRKLFKKKTKKIIS